MRAIPSAVRAEHLLQDLQNDMLEAIAVGEPLERVADWICRYAEAISPGVICSILTIEAGGRLRQLAGPSLPPAFARAIDGIAIGPEVGSCGAAACRGEPVGVSDIETDPLWAPYAELALPHGLRACWSSPIKARDGGVVGTFAFYYRTRRGPEPLERRIVETSVHLCAIAIEREAVQAHNRRLAYQDTLTGLSNRAAFNDAIARRTSPGQPRFGLLLIDIDHLKSVNDTLGHAAGDTLIETVARRIAGAGLPGIAFRIGGDELAFLLDDCADAGPLRLAAKRIIAAMAAPCVSGGHAIQPSVTIGGAVSGFHGDDAATLRQNADFALYHAKETRRGGYARYRRGMRTTMTQRGQTIRAVDAALADDRLTAYFQPVVRIDTAEIVGLEALARMRLPDGRIVSAGSFVQAMGDQQVAHKLTGRMLKEVGRALRGWLDAGIAPQHVGINLTTADFLRGDLVQRLARAFARQEVPVERIILEVTETVLMGSGDGLVARSIAAIRERGMLVALDDFGTGHASLTHLMKVPVDLIKIDRSFVAELSTDSPSAAIVEALIGIARRLDMRIVAEGIEEQAQAEALLKLGCRLGQGYLYARPMPASAMTDLLRRFGQRKGAKGEGTVLPFPVKAA